MKFKFTFFTLLLVMVGTLQAQVSDTLFNNNKKEGIYRTSSGELIFSLVDMEVNGETVDPVLRFSAFFHFMEQWNFDIGDHFGFQAGIAMRNVGFITRDDPIRIQEHADLIDGDDEVDIKRRSYSLGIPIGLKIGKLNNGAFFFGGVEPELMFHYKEKLFVNGDKDDKYNEWFSDRVNLINPSVYAGIQFKGGINLRFKYYLLDFLNTDYEEVMNGKPNFPYENVSSQMFYISVSAGLLPDSRREEPVLPEDRT